MRRKKRVIANMSVVLLIVLGKLGSAEATKKDPLPDASLYLSPHPMPGSTLSDITYRVISIYSSGIEDSVGQMPATATLTILPSDSPETIRYTADARADGKAVLKGIAGEYRNRVTQTCYDGKCITNLDASSTFDNYAPLEDGLTDPMCLPTLLRHGATGVFHRGPLHRCPDALAVGGSDRSDQGPDVEYFALAEIIIIRRS